MLVICKLRNSAFGILCGFMPVLCSSSQLAAQPGYKECGFARFAEMDSVLDRELGPLFPWLLNDTSAASAMRRAGLDTFDVIYYDPPYPTPDQAKRVYGAIASVEGEIADSLADLVDQYGSPRLIARSLLLIIHGNFSEIQGADQRGAAADAYGLLHSMYPEEVLAAPLASLLMYFYYPDEVRSALAKSTLYFSEEIPEFQDILSIVLCQAMLHLRPFVLEDPATVREYARNSLLWYSSAVELLDNVVRALAGQPDGMGLIEDRLAQEPSPLLAAYVREVATASQWPPPRR